MEGHFFEVENGLHHQLGYPYDVDQNEQVLSTYCFPFTKMFSDHTAQTADSEHLEEIFGKNVHNQREVCQSVSERRCTSHKLESDARSNKK